MIFAGSRAPIAVQIVVSTTAVDSGGVDLTLATAAALYVKKPGGAVSSWIPTISEQTKASLKLTYVFSATGLDVPDGGQYQVWPKLTIGGGEVPCRLAVLTVEPGI